MKIDDNNLAALGAQTTQINRTNQTGRADHGGRAARVGAGGDDHVEISGLGAAIAAQQSDSPVRAAKIDSLATAYQAGTYRVDSTTLAKDIAAESSASVGGPSA